MPSVTRRHFLKTTASALAGAAVGGCSHSRPKPRNAIVIIADSLRRDALSCFGGNWIHTPHLNAFARQAMLCDNAFCCSFPTVPARHDILTGTYSYTYKRWGALSPGTVTLPEVLNAAGVHTALVADTPHPYTPKFHFHRGFQYFERIHGQEGDIYKTEPQVVRLPCSPSKLRRVDTVEQYLRNVADRKVEEDYFCAQTMRAAARWLQKSYQAQPFFLLVDTFDPHEPWDPPRSYVDHYDPGYQGQDIIYPKYDYWRRTLTEAEFKHCRALYAAEATLMDRWFGHLIETIENLGLLENSFILFLSDHGISLGEHGILGKAIMRDHGYQNFPLYPDLCRIPILAYYPGCSPGARIQALVQPVDLPATICDCLGVIPPVDFRGSSMWSALQQKEEHGRRFVVSSPTLSGQNARPPRPTDEPSITDGRWLLAYPCAGWGDDLEQKPHNPDYQRKRRAYYTDEPLVPLLFDLEKDPGCIRNIIEQNKDVARDMHHWFYAALTDSPMNRRHLDFYRELENS
jgi:arylsulfatase A-like enzyme